ncbi:hypothetical protein AB2N04_17485 [Nitratireductor sp. GISD-1A_MAKvit]|uniref:hypothetical protein n=1 Tax=Nitratireductor sp. GISD-1A_MAKvit TaxID=3234198 RepID=UPI0034651BD1
MHGIAFLFFLSASLYALAGMGFGIHMAASHDHTLASAHAHLNLIGWVTLGVSGLYYHSVPQAAASRLAWLHFATASLGLWMIVPGIVLALKGVTEALAIAGSLVTILSMALFVAIIYRSRAAGSDGSVVS